MIPSPGCPPAQALPGAAPAACGGEGGRFARWSGVLASLALVGLLLLLARLGFRVQNPNLLFALALVLAAYLGGLPAGLSSAAIAIAYTLVDWSTPGHLFTYALGRQPEVDDEAVLQQLTQSFGDQGYRMKELLVQLTLSPTFRMRTTQQEAHQ